MKLLVSVRSAEEAREAILGGADIVDVKEPALGSLGRASQPTIESVVSEVRSGGRDLLVTVALGEMRDLSVPSVFWGLPGVRHYKLGGAGLSLSRWVQMFTAWRRAARAGNLADDALVPVAYVDWQRCGAPDPSSIVGYACRSQAKYVLFDTWGKDGRGVFHWAGEGPLRDWVRTAQTAGVSAVVAGGLRVEEFARVRDAGATVVAVRTAAAGGESRLAEVRRQVVEQLRRAAGGSDGTAPNRE